MNNHIIIKKLRTSVLWLCGILMPLPWGGVGAGLLSSCTDWDDHYEAAATAEGSGLSLWQQLKSQQQLSDFCQVLEQTKVFRMHKKTSVSYADLLDAGQSFTVIAPVNGTFNRDSLLQLVETAQGDSMVEKSFVLNHLSRSLTSVTAADGTIRMLNSKNVVLQNGTAEGISLQQPNVHARNGILHVAERPMPFMHNIYEALCDRPELSGIGSRLRDYETDYFNADASVSSGIVEGVPVYVDSVVTAYNKMLQYIDFIDAEDSLFWVVAPTTAGWERAWQDMTHYFVYDEKTLKRDSLQQYWTVRALMDDAVFNMTDQYNTNDSLVSVRYRIDRLARTGNKPLYHVYYKPFEPGGILYGAKEVACSNGLIYETAEWPYSPFNTYFVENWAETERTSLIMAEKDCTYNPIAQPVDSVSEGYYLFIEPRTSTSNWELTFRLNDVLSGNYDVYAIVLPRNVGGTPVSASDLRPCKFKATINYITEDGSEKSFNCDNKQFTTDPLRVDTVLLAENFRFPATNFQQTDNRISLKLACSITTRETANYSRRMCLDCIYLRPRTSKSE